MSDIVEQRGNDNRSLMWQGTVAMMPLSIAVVPWGLLAGSYAVESGLLVIEAQALSAILFAGAAQLVAIGMFNTGASLVTMLITTFFITSRHLLYSVAMRETISPLPLRWRLTLGFLLTDELFALIGHRQTSFNRYYALGAGLSFYLIWNLASFVGIIGGSVIPNLDSLGLDFAIVATFIALVVPNVKTKPVLLTVLVALVSSVVLHRLQVNGALMIASLVAMIAGYAAERYGVGVSTESSQDIDKEKRG
ncbi:AzlC family ABC transporter permease [Thaumasiovibrio subtropicus]|uniref:AzlC family ABC transporter permease n=1 Tax=Thaumasiovibrio subtropicus TaxID=1891207 RepID=UPI000B35097D|nr:AzlC family ABC transporter permease [Thaumasiovibrio subtropicus]